MDDDKLQHLVTLYLDGELNGFSRWRRWQINRRLGWCEKTQGCYEFEMAYRQVIVSKCREEVPGDLRDRIVVALGLTETRWYRENPPPHDARPPAKPE